MDPVIPAALAQGEEERTRLALLHMLEDLQSEQEVVRQARRQWVDTVDAIHDPLAVLDAGHRVVRCNRAYAMRAGMDFAQVLGRPYWECFPKGAGHLPAMEARTAEFALDDGAILVSRAYPVRSGEDKDDVLYVFEDVTAKRRAEQAEKDRLARVMAQTNAAAAISSSEALLAGDVERLAREITECAAHLTGVERANVWLFDADESQLRCIDLYGATPARHSAGMVLKQEQFRNEFRALKAAPYVDADDPLTDPRTAGYVESYLKPLGITSMLHAVVQFAGRRLGLLCLEHVGPAHHWEPDEITFACRLADRIALALVQAERRSAEKATRHSEERFRGLVENSADVIWEMDEDGVYTYVSPRSREVLGYLPEELVGKSAFDLLSPDEAERTRAWFAPIQSRAAPFSGFENVVRRKDGSLVVVESSGTPILDAEGRLRGYRCIDRDITERKAADEKIRALARFPDENPNAVMRVAADGTVMYANAASGPVQAYAEAAVGGRINRGCLETVQRALNSRELMRAEIQHRGRIFALTFAPIEGAGYVNVYGTDISERKRYENELRFSNAVLTTQQETALDGILVVDNERRIVSYNRRFVEMWRVPEEVIRTRSDEAVIEAVLGCLEAPDDFLRSVTYLFEHETEKLQDELALRDGRTIERFSAPMAGSDGHYYGRVFYFRDITEREHAKARLEESNQRLALATQSARIGIWDWDIVNDKLLWDSRMYELYGVRKEDFSGAYEAWRSGLHPDDLERGDAAIAAATATGSHFELDFRVVWPNGEVRHIEAYGAVQRSPNGTATRMIGVNTDITERRTAELRLRKVNRALRTLSACNEALVRGGDEASLLQEMTRILTTVGGYAVSFVGYAVHDEARSVEPKAWAGLDGSVLRRAPISWGENGQTTVGRAIRLGQAQLVRGAHDSAAYAQWREIFGAMGIQAVLALPLRLAPGEDAFGALCIAATDNDAFDAEELRLLSELAGDLAYGIANLRSGIERRAATEKLRRGLENTVGAIAATMETRDPYTAGHQRRVADLAAAIAREMGLPADSVEGIHFGALIHDLGKIQVPSEILAKPTRLTKLEFELIKTHSQAGYEIIKGIEFPWPVAQMVLQHHERLDGSGYPNGAKGEEISLEARILAVADVVEAMASHRPYRPGLGIEAALKEIEDKRGRWFEPAAVDACLTLFRDKGFALDKT